MFYWTAFWELSCDRQLGMAPGPIPFTSIDRYAGRYGIRQIDDFEGFRHVMRAMDGVYLEKAPAGAVGGAVRADDAAGVMSFAASLKATVNARHAATTKPKTKPASPKAKAP
jgi:hypothetical protein